MVSLPTKAQWKSILTNTVLTFVSTFAITLSAGDLDKATVVSAATAGLMAAFKTIQKLLSDEKLS